MKLKKNDLVQVTSGKDRGKTGKIEKVFPDELKVLVPGVNQYKKHKKPQGESKQGEILTLNRPLPVGNVALVCPKCKQLTRVGFRLNEGKKIRVCRKCDADID
jgi:large subunit ribosomal protein L24